jgi:hypothetical protein
MLSQYYIVALYIKQSARTASLIVKQSARTASLPTQSASTASLPTQSANPVYPPSLPTQSASEPRCKINILFLRYCMSGRALHNQYVVFLRSLSDSLLDKKNSES